MVSGYDQKGLLLSRGITSWEVSSQFHIRHELEKYISMDTSLVDMYSKCDDLVTAQRCFNWMPDQDVVSWSVIIGGYASHGMREVTLKMYSDFLDADMKMNNA